VVIAPGPVTDYAPLYKGARDELTTQWNMKEVERIGLLKMDFLGLSTLTLIADCLDEIRRTEGVELDIDAVPLDDAKTYRLFGEGATYGIFQFESSGMRELLRKARPERLDDLIALNALYRPGPLKSGMVDDWVSRKQGRTPVTYELAELEPILSDTYGVIAYQEQVMRIAQALAGFSLGQADVLRKAMGKKDPAVMAKQREAFTAGARATGISEKKARKIFDLMEYFAGYGFNKSHSTAYALLAYQTAYLKANYPWHFAAALLTIEAQNTDKLAMYMVESRDRGIPVLPPDINESALRFTVEPGRGVRFGLTAIKGLGEGAIRAVLAARTALGGRIPSLHALCEGLDLRVANKRVFEALVKSGACDTLTGSLTHPPLREPLRAVRARLFAAIDGACEHGSRLQRNRDLGQVDLFGAGEPSEGPRPEVPLPEVPAWTEIEQLTYEKESLGLYWSGHPIDRYADALRAYGSKTTTELVPKREGPEERDPAAGDAAADGGAAGAGPGAAPPAGSGRVAMDVSIGGIISSVRALKTRKGDRMAVFMLDDAGGTLEVVVFPEAFRQHGHLVESDAAVLVHGRFERDEETARLVAAEIAPIEQVRERLTTELAIRVSSPPCDRTTFERLLELLARHKGDRRVAFVIDEPDRHLRVTADVRGIRVRPSELLVSEVEKICGAGSVSLH
jgi:DNA polymerase-3 subunit alpha